MANEKEVVKEARKPSVTPNTPVAPTNGAPAQAPRGDGRPPRHFDRHSKRPGGRRPNDREKEYEEIVVEIKRISKTVSGGRKMRFSALAVVGNRKGLVGFGTGKANEVPDAIKKAVEAAKKNITKVHVCKNDTVPHTQIGHWGACDVFLRPAPEGTGIIAGGAVRSVIELAGYRNIYSKIYGSRTAINVVRSTINGLKNMRTANRIASLRGKEISQLFN